MTHCEEEAAGFTGLSRVPEVDWTLYVFLQVGTRRPYQHTGGPSDAESQRHRGVTTPARVSQRSRGRVNRRGMLSKASEFICLIYRQTLVSASDQDDCGLLEEEAREGD